MNLPAPHPNLTQAINDNIQKMLIDGGVWVLNHWEGCNAEIKAQPVLPVGRVLIVQTQNTRYRIIKTGDETFTIQGHPCRIHGSTWGGSMLRVGWIGRGMHLEYSLLGNSRGAYITSRIMEIKEVPSA